MLRALWTGATGMKAQSRNVDVIANNLANINTVGFKKQNTVFADLIYQSLKKAGTLATQGSVEPTGIEVGHGVRNVATPRSFVDGELQNTEQELDIAIQGDGFFQVEYLDGSTVYTRDGTFTLNQEGEIVTSSGHRLIPAMTVPQEAIQVNIGIDGMVTAVNQDDTVEELGQIEIAKFVNPAGLASKGDNLFGETDASGDAQTGAPGDGGRGTLLQGFIELSNANAVDEIVNMIKAQRAYELNSRVIRTADSMLSEVARLKT